MRRFIMTEARKQRGRHDVSELKLAWKRQKAADQTEDKWRQGCYEKCEGCDNTREECVCPCTACGGTGYVVTVSGGPFNVTGRRHCVVCNYEKSALKRGTEIHEDMERGNE